MTCGCIVCVSCALPVCSTGSKCTVCLQDIPVDKATKSKFFFRFDIHDRVDSLQGMCLCANKNGKCNWKGNVGQWKIHTLSCVYKLIRCDKCKKEFCHTDFHNCSAEPPEASTLELQCLERIAIQDKIISDIKKTFALMYSSMSLQIRSLTSIVDAMATQCRQIFAYKGSVIWKIERWSVILENARSGSAQSIESKVFTIAHIPYAFAVRIFPMGSKATHMAVFLMCTKGLMDEVLKWPVTFNFILTLFNSDPNKNHSVSFSGCSANKPTESHVSAMGMEEFMTHEQVVSGFLIDNCIYMRCSVAL